MRERAAEIKLRLHGMQRVILIVFLSALFGAGQARTADSAVPAPVAGLAKSSFAAANKAAGTGAPGEAGRFRPFEATGRATALRMRVVKTNHPSGIYWPGQKGIVTLAVKNISTTPQTLAGNLKWLFQPFPEHLGGIVKRQRGRLLATTPINKTVVPPGRSMLIRLPVRFEKAGGYQLRWQGRSVYSGNAWKRHIPFMCVYRPAGENLPVAESHWLSHLPRAFFQYPQAGNGYIADYMRRTGIRRFTLTVYRGQSGPRRTFRILPALDNAGGKIALVVVLDGATHLNWGEHFLQTAVVRFRRQLARALQRLGPLCQALVIAQNDDLSASLNWDRWLKPAYRRSILQARRVFAQTVFSIAKRANPNLPILATPRVLKLGFTLRTRVKHKPPGGCLDGVAVPDRTGYMPLVHQLALGHPPVRVWVLPPQSYAGVISVRRRMNAGGSGEPGFVGLARRRHVNPAIALASGAAVAPLGFRRAGIGYIAHLLGSAVLFRTVHPYLPPLLAVFQRQGYAVAVVAGLGAGSVRDVQWAAWKHWPPEIRKLSGRPLAELIKSKHSPRKAYKKKKFPWSRCFANAYPIGRMVIFDPEGVMRGFNSQGEPLKTRYPGEVEIPLNKQLFFVKAPGAARNLVAALRTAELHGLPPAAMAPFWNKNGKVCPSGSGAYRLEIVIRNARVGRLPGKLRVMAFKYPKPNSQATALARTSPPTRVPPVGAKSALWSSRWRKIRIPSGGITELEFTVPPNLITGRYKFTAVLRMKGREERIIFH